MKKNWLTLLALACSVALFTACSDDDEPARASVDTVNGTYTSTDTEKQLALTYGDAVMTGKSVTFNSADGQSATITLTGAANTLLSGLTGQTVNNPGVIPGEASTTLNVTLVPQGETGYTFSGTDQSNDRTVAYTGSVEAGKLTLDVDVTFANDLIGTWNLCPYDPYGTVNPLHIAWTSSTPFSVVLFPIPGAEPIELQPGALLTLASAIGLIGDGMTLHEAMAALLQSVTFNADGSIVASYSDAANLASPQWQNSPADMVQYCVKGDQIYAYLNIDAIIASVAGASSNTKALDIADLLPIITPYIPQLVPMLSNGIPLSYSVNEEGGLSVYLDESGLGQVVLALLSELVQNEKIVNTIKELATSNPDFAMFAGAMDSILAQMPDVIAGTTELELGLNFTPSVAE